LATREDLPILNETLQKGGALEVLREAVSAMTGLFSDEDVLAAMSTVILDYHPVVARMAAEAAVPRTPLEKLLPFVEKNQQKLAAQVLAVFDWHLFAPRYLKDAYPNWRSRQTVPVLSW
jgi:hypothetical protein